MFEESSLIYFSQFLRTTKDIEAGTLLSYAGFPGTIHPPRQHAVERKRKVGLTKRPTAAAAATSSEGGQGDVSVVSGGGAADTSIEAIPIKEHVSISIPKLDVNNHDIGSSTSDVVVDRSSLPKPSMVPTRFAVTPETSKGGSRGHSDLSNSFSV